jgi:hypothetical protein
MLPCNVVIRHCDLAVEVAAIGPVASIQAIADDPLFEKVQAVADKLRRVVERLRTHQTAAL